MEQIHGIRFVNTAPVVASDQAVSFSSPTHNFTVEFLKERVEFSHLPPHPKCYLFKGRGQRIRLGEKLLYVCRDALGY